VRDLALFEVAGLTLVVACDANASTGMKPNDRLQQDPAITGYSAAKVPLMEVLASGATPLLLVNNLCCELEPYGRRILDGIHQALRETVGGVVIAGSDETNMPTTQTGVGVTVIGAGRTGDLLLGRARHGDVVACAGVPKDGLSAPYTEGEPGIATVRHVVAAVQSALVHEVLPVGSRGVRCEALELADVAGLKLEFGDERVDLRRSAGASTCFLVATPAEHLGPLRELLGLPVERVGELR
jgi:selenophosphate synthetase-related protein